MKHLIPLSIIGALFVSCGSPSPDGANVSVPDSPAVHVDTTAIAAEWPGYYTDTMPCSDCPGIDTQLWIRSDSTFILQQKYIGRDSLPQGIIGQWHTVNGLMTVGYTGDKPEFYRYTKEGLLTVDEMGVADASKVDWTLDKLADEIGDAIPRMRLKGTFTYIADAQSFQPCGSNFTWPCAGGMDMGEEEGEPLVAFTNADLQKAYRKAVKKGGDPWVIEAICTMGMGTAMEGDGADEYVYIEQVPRTIDRCP
jgi:copper homeostasis protein (lipoprotein)